MKIGVVSDTHDNLRLTEFAVKKFNNSNVDIVIHCGDFTSPFSVTPFDTGNFKFHAVRGNNDGEWGIQGLIESFGTFFGEAGEMSIDGKSVAIYHGSSSMLTESLVDSGRYDIVLSGHTHERQVKKSNNTIKVNPGGLPLPSTDDDKFSVATINTAESGVGSVTHHHY